MKFVSTDLPGVVIAEPQVFRDERGFLMETWHAKKFADAGIHETFVQEVSGQSGEYDWRPPDSHLDRLRVQWPFITAIPAGRSD